MVILLLNLNEPEQTPVDTGVADTPPVPGTSELPAEWGVTPGELLQLRSADLTTPLEQELTDLQSDLEKVRENLEREVPFSF